MNKKLILVVVFIVTSLFNTSRANALTEHIDILEIRFTIQNNGLILDSINRQKGYVNFAEVKNKGIYKLEIRGKRKILYSTSFDDSVTVLGDTVENGSLKSGTTSTQVLKSQIVSVPVIEESERLVVTNSEGRILIDEDIRPLVQVEDKQPTKSKQSSWFRLEILGIFVLVLLGAGFYLKKRRQSQLASDSHFKI